MPKKRSQRGAPDGMAPPEGSSSPVSRRAVCIGVGSPEMERDAIDVAEALQARDYHLCGLLTGLRADLQAVRTAFEQALSGPGTALLFLSAHAGYSEHTEDCYIATHGVSDQNPSQLERRGLSMAELREMCVQSDCDVILILDTCYSGAVTCGQRVGGSEGRVFVASSSPGRVSKFVDDASSVLTGVLVAVLRCGGVDTLHVLADEAGLDSEWIFGIDCDLVEQWEQAGSQGLKASVLAELVVQLVGAGLSPVLDEPRPVIEVWGRDFRAL